MLLCDQYLSEWLEGDHDGGSSMCCIAVIVRKKVLRPSFPCFRNDPCAVSFLMQALGLLNPVAFILSLNLLI